jgi:hypothetical protein
MRTLSRTARSLKSLIAIALLLILAAGGAVAAPPTRVSKEEVQAWLKLQEITDGTKGRYTMTEWIIQNGDHDYYPASQLKEFKPFAANIVQQGQVKAELERKRVFKGIKIREKFDDVLRIEDPTTGAPATRKKDDLKGASVSFARDFDRDLDTWSGKGAIIFPFVWDTGAEYRTGDFDLMVAGLVPSISLTKFTTEDPAKKDIDSLVYRMGAFATFYGPEPVLTELNIRAYGTLGTDTHHRAKVVAGEFEIEPRWDFRGPWAIGYQKWIPLPGRTAEPIPPKTQPTWALLSYQLSTSIHGEFGEVKNNGGNNTILEEEFVRVGPVVKLKIQPGSIPQLTLDASYRHLFVAKGPRDHNSLFEASAEWTLWQDEDAGRKVSAKVSYLNGGLDLTAQDAKVLTAGFGVTY